MVSVTEHHFRAHHFWKLLSKDEISKSPKQVQLVVVFLVLIFIFTVRIVFQLRTGFVNSVVIILSSNLYSKYGPLVGIN